MIRVVLLFLLSMPIVSIADTEHTTKSVLSEYFRYGENGPRLKMGQKTISLEICFDTCDYYRAIYGTAESNLWDLAFLHQYYINNMYHLENFRAKYVDVAKQTLNKHADGCDTSNEKQFALCAISKLADQMKAYYAFVRYDEGYRCEVSGRIMDPGFKGKTKCREL